MRECYIICLYHFYVWSTLDVVPCSPTSVCSNHSLLYLFIEKVLRARILTVLFSLTMALSRRVRAKSLFFSGRIREKMDRNNPQAESLAGDSRSRIISYQIYMNLYLCIFIIKVGKFKFILRGRVRRTTGRCVWAAWHSPFWIQMSSAALQDLDTRINIMINLGNSLIINSG